jgi:DNA polymerase-3 subunit epsilon
VPGYLVIDVETTGFSPARHDRIVEVGVVQVDAAGAIEDHWSTLINPARDIGATHVHGITAADVITAPTFQQIAPRLIAAMAGRTLVAHNARFDLSFLHAELARAGMPLSADPPYLCTMEWSSRFLHGTSRKLGDCCRLAAVANDCGHSAEGDSLATAGLLAYYLRTCGSQPPWSAVLQHADGYPWPTTLSTIDVALVRRTAHPPAPDDWLDKVTSNAARVADPLVESYVDVLERALLDGHLSAHEKHDLIAIAETLGLAREQLDAVHRLYLAALASAAWSDGVVTIEEQVQLTQVAASLAIPLAEAKQILIEAQGTRTTFEVPTLHLVAGDRVVFTGELSLPRDEWIARIAKLGLEHGTVTKATRVVVAADPDSLSGKAAKARGYGIPIVTELAFEAIVRQIEEHRAARTQMLAE